MFPGVAKNTIVQILGRGGVILTTIITTALLTRLLGITGYGNYVFIISLIMLLVTVSDWGTNLIFVREAAKDTVDQQKIFGNALLFRLFLAGACLLVINLLIGIVPQLKILSTPIRVGSLLLLLISVKTSCHVVFQTKLKFEYLAFIDVFISSLFFIALLLFTSVFKNTGGLTAIMFLFVGANLLGSVLAIRLVVKMTKLIFKIDKIIFQKIILEALPTGALLLVFSIYNRIDILILQILKGPESVGIYGLSYKVHDNLILGAAYLAGSLFPVISKVIGKGGETRSLLEMIYRKTFDILLLTGGTILLGAVIFSPLIISIIGGPEFSASILPLRILAFATLIAYFNHLTGYTLIALGKQRISLIVALLALFWNLGLNLIFIPQYSYLAAAMVTIATEAFVFILTSLYLAKKFGLRPGLTFLNTLTELIKTRGKIF